MQVIAPNVININPKIAKEATNPKAWSYAKRKFYLWMILGDQCKDCCTAAYRKDGSPKRMDIHHVVYIYGFDSKWSQWWKICSTHRFKSRIIPEVKECCMLLCRTCHRKRHGLYKKRR